MKTPRNLKNAIESDYLITRINYAGTKLCRVNLKPRFFRPGMKAVLSFWISTEYVKRNYPKSFAANAAY